jgi:hypothetical protein
MSFICREPQANDKVTYVQRVHYLAEINDEFHIVFNYIAKLGAYGCLFDEHTINTPIKEDNNPNPKPPQACQKS